MQAIIDFLKRLFGLDQPKSEEQVWLEDKIKQKEQELEKIDEEDNSPSDNVDYLND